MGDTPAIKIAALDEEDLAVISAHLQDAVLPVGDLRWMKNTAKLSIVANRYVHFCATRAMPASGGCAGCRYRGSAASARATSSWTTRRPLSRLLAMTFIPGAEAPEGTIELSFAGGGAVRIEVECIEVAMADLVRPGRRGHGRTMTPA